MNHGPDEKGPEGLELGPAGHDPGAEERGRGAEGRGNGPAGSGSGPDGRGAGFAAGGSGPGPDGSGPGSDGPRVDLAGLGDDELALRRMLHSAVDDLEPRTGTLDRLRRAVPARRARKRQAAVGMAAAALFIGTAIPALVHVSHSGGTEPDTAMAGQSSQAQGGTGQSPDQGGDTGTGKGPGSTSVQPGRPSGKPGGKARPGGGTTGSTGGVNPSPTLAAGGVPQCKPAQLGSATGTADAPDSAGVVYGTFRVANVSSGACTVAGAGTVTPTAVGAADKTRISAVRHAAGDAATSLPDPSQEVSGLVLQPGSAYEEKFAFVPSQSCPTSSPTGGSGSGGASPDPTPTASGGSADGAGPGGTATQPAAEDGTAGGSVRITHTGQGGSPSATATVPGECAGTVYYTGVLAGS